jgi:hypothetical protein
MRIGAVSHIAHSGQLLLQPGVDLLYGLRHTIVAKYERTPKDAEFIIGRKFQVIEIVRIIRVPPHVLSDHVRQRHRAFPVSDGD